MRAIQIQSAGKIGAVEVPEPVLQEGEALVELKAAALNHRDVWIKLGQYAALKFPCIPGSDGAGVVRAVGVGANPSWIGHEVIINPSFDWGPSERAQGASFSILGMPRDGTLADKVSVPASQLSPKPAHMSWDEAAALPLSGLTAWRALVTRAGMSRGDRVLVTGIGGGGALFALQFAVASGNEVWVTSSSDEKIAKAVGLGAKGGYRYDRKDWASDAVKATGPFDVIIDSAGGPGFASLVDAAAPGGRVATFGATRGNAAETVMRKIYWKQLSIVGSTMGNPADWRAMNDFVSRHSLKPVISDVFPFERALEAFDLMERGGQFGKIVVRH